MNLQRPLRRGVALIIVMILLAVVAAVSATMTWNALASRAFLRQRENQLQAHWLAQGGLARARAQIARGENVSEAVWRPLGEKTEVVVRKEKSGSSIQSTATFPADEPRPVVREATANVKGKS